LSLVRGKVRFLPNLPNLPQPAQPAQTAQPAAPIEAQSSPKAPLNPSEPSVSEVVSEGSQPKVSIVIESVVQEEQEASLAAEPSIESQPADRSARKRKMKLATPSTLQAIAPKVVSKEVDEVRTKKVDEPMIQQAWTAFGTENKRSRPTQFLLDFNCDYHQSGGHQSHHSCLEQVARRANPRWAHGHLSIYRKPSRE